MHGVLLLMKKLLILILLSIFLVGCDGCPEGQKMYHTMTCADGTFSGSGPCPITLCECTQYCQ